MGTHYKGTEKEIRALNTYIKLSRAVQSVKSRIDLHKTAELLSDSQFGVLEALYHIGPLSQKEIAQKLLFSKSNIVAVIDALEEKGLAKRQRDLQDRRFVNVNITAEGSKLLEGLLPRHIEAITEEFACLTDVEQDELARLCRKLGLQE
jgi:MarR family 2-MHQ and catechol resistance regulon transcriptional repressor